MVVGRIGYLLVLLVVGLFTGCIGGLTEYFELIPVVESTDQPTPVVEIGALTGAVFATVDCEACHAKSLEYVPHVDGDGYCYDCHGKDPHEIHTGEGSIDLACAACHGSIEALAVPDAGEGRTACGLCHNPIDPSKPERNLVNIHISRGKPCTVCHTEKLDEIHITADEGASS